MKKISPLVLAFYLVFAVFNPAPARAAVPLALIAAGAIGASLLSSSAGTYYAQTGQAPEWVAATASGVASLSDAIFQPSYLAQAVGLLFTPQSLNTAQQYYVGKAAAVGATIQNITDYVKTTAETSYTDLKALIAADSVDTGLSESQFQNGVVFTAIDGKRIILEDFVQVGWDPYYYYNMNAAYEESVRPGSRITPYIHTSGEWIYKFVNGGTYRSRTAITTTGDPLTSPPPYINGAVLSNDLKTPSSGVQNDLQDVIKNLPDQNKIVANDTPATVGAAIPPNALTQAAIQAAIAANNAAVAAQVAANAAELAAANPNDAALQLAAQQAAIAANQAAQAAQSAETAEPEDYTASAPSLTIPALKAVSFQPIIDARNLTMTKAPFTWFGTLPGILDDLVASPSAPNFTIDLGIIQQNIDLAFLDPFASTCRSIVAFFMYLMTVFLMIKIFRSM